MLKREIVIIFFVLVFVGILLSKDQIVSGGKTIVDLTNIVQNESEKEEAVIASLSSLDKIFADDHSWTATLSAEKTIIMIATGDVLPARTVNFQTVAKNDFLWPYVHTADFVRDADITFINLETPLLQHCPVTQTGMIFCGDSKNVAGLSHIGTDIANLANNHTTNWQKAGVDETMALLKQNNIAYTGIDGPLYQQVKGVNFAFLGYNDISKGAEGISDADEEKIKQEIAEARKQADIVIVQYHWGVEYRSQPDDRQMYLGHMTIDAGADLVIGNHPHWVQPVEFYNGKLITYAHGNYIFDQEWSLKTKQGVIGKYIFFDKQLVDVEYFPLLISDYGQATFYEGEGKTKMLDEMEQESRVLQ
jgi:hypothetical protein